MSNTCCNSHDEWSGLDGDQAPRQGVYGRVLGVLQNRRQAARRRGDPGTLDSRTLADIGLTRLSAQFCCQAE
jgi:uncharacterized protein YjiS (DUF1127 family)